MSDERKKKSWIQKNPAITTGLITGSCAIVAAIIISHCSQPPPPDPIIKPEPILIPNPDPIPQPELEQVPDPPPQKPKSNNCPPNDCKHYIPQPVLEADCTNEPCCLPVTGEYSKLTHGSWGAIYDKDEHVKIIQRCGDYIFFFERYKPMTSSITDKYLNETWGESEGYFIELSKYLWEFKPY